MKGFNQALRSHGADIAVSGSNGTGNPKPMPFRRWVWLLFAAMLAAGV